MMLKALTRQPELSPELRLIQAISEFEAGLSQDEKTKFKAQRAQSPDQLEVLRFTAQLDRLMFAKGLRRGYGPRLTKFLEGVQKFASVGDVLIGGSQSLPACAVWTLVRFSLLSIVQHSEYVDRLSELFMQIGRSTPRYKDMALLFPQSQKLQDSFIEYYIVVVHLCHKFMKLSRTSGFKQFLNSYGDTFTRVEKQLDTLAGYIRDEMNIQSVVLAQEENKETSRFRMLAKIDREALKKRQEEKERLRILDACSIYDYQTTWKQIRKLGNTALHNNDSTYQSWKSSTCASTLVFSGRLGAGKSVLLANIVDDLVLDLRGVSVAYFFCRHDTSESLKQLDLPHLHDQKSFSVDDLLLVISRTCSKLDRVVYLVIDGLEDCVPKERDLLLEGIKRCQESEKILLCISSRWEPDTQSKFRPNQLISPVYSSIPEQNSEVEAYVEAEIDACVNSGRLQVAHEGLIPAIKKILSLNSKGMFLWVSLLITCICDLNSDHDISQALEDLPQSLADIYQRLLDRYTATHEQYQEAILQLILVAYRPLSAQELREALSVKTGEVEWNTARLSNNITELLACCGGIIIIDEEDLSVRFVHESARQFLLDRGSSDASGFTVIDAEKRMAQILTTYLNFAVFDTRISTIVTPKISGSTIIEGVIATVPQHSKLLIPFSRLMKSSNAAESDISRILAETAMQARTRKLPDLLLEAYAREYWFLHSAPALDDSMTQDLARKLIQKGLEIQRTDMLTPASWAIRNSHVAAFEYLFTANLLLSEAQQYMRASIVMGEQETIKQYLESTESFSVQDRNNLNCDLLIYAAFKKWSHVMKLLLHDTYMQRRIWNAIVASCSTGKVLCYDGSNDQLIDKILLDAAAKKWTNALKPLSNQTIWSGSMRNDEGNAIRHKELARNCLNLLCFADCLSKKDICRLKTPDVLRKEIGKTLINHHLSSEIQYACHYWVLHLEYSGQIDREWEDHITRFLIHRFLFWYEAVILTDEALNTWVYRGPPGTDMRSLVGRLAQLHYSDPQILSIVKDLKQFVAQSHDLVWQMPLQLYYSCLIFTEWSNKVQMIANKPGWLIKAPEAGEEKHTGPIESIVFSPDGKFLASGSEDETIKLWNTTSGELQGMFTGHLRRVKSVSFSPNAELLASGSYDTTVKVWNIASGELKRTFTGHSGWIGSVAFWSDSKVVASGSEDKTIKVWDVTSGILVRTLTGHTSMVNSLSFSPDGRLLASGADDSSIKLWDMASGKAQRTLVASFSRVRLVSFSPDGKFLASMHGTGNGSIQLWKVASGELSRETNHEQNEAFFEFDSNFLQLYTHPDCFHTGDSVYLKRPEVKVKPKSMLNTSDNWITRNGQRIICLPKERRVAKLAFSHGLVAIGLKSGHIVIFKLSLDGSQHASYEDTYREAAIPSAHLPIGIAL